LTTFVSTTQAKNPRRRSKSGPARPQHSPRTNDHFVATRRQPRRTPGVQFIPQELKPCKIAKPDATRLSARLPKTTVALPGAPRTEIHNLAVSVRGQSTSEMLCPRALKPPAQGGSLW
jgi:hypothetical protein